MATVATISALVRSLLGDDEAGVYTDSTLLPAVNSAHRDLQSRLVNGGCRVLVTRATLNLAALVTQLSTTSTPTLPTDFMGAYKMWEKDQGALNSTYVPVAAKSELTDRDQTNVLGEWQAEAGNINLIGATAAKTIRLEYERVVPDFVDQAGVLPILLSENALAHFTAALMASSRGQRDMASDLQTMAEKATKELSTRFTRMNQVIQGVRRKSYGQWSI